MPVPATDARGALEARWTARIARARLLAAEGSAAAGILSFYAALAARQHQVVEDSWPVVSPANTAGAFRDSLDLEVAADAIPGLLTWLAGHAPDHLAASAADLGETSAADWHRVLTACVNDETDAISEATAARVFVASALLQPLAERQAVLWPTPPTPPIAPGELAPRAECLVCGGRPVLGVLREEGHGAKRAIVCAFCLTERDYVRVVCPSCGEQRFDALPVYTADELAHVRIEACDTCRTYLKTIDLTKHGRAVPIVDDFASVAMDLWAREHGYERLQPNLLKI